METENSMEIAKKFQKRKTGLKIKNPKQTFKMLFWKFKN